MGPRSSLNKIYEKVVAIELTLLSSKDKYKSKLEYNFLILFFNKKSLMIPLQHKKIGKYIMLTNKKVAQLRHSAVFMGLNT